MFEIAQKARRIFSFWRVYNRFLKEINASAKAKSNKFEEILRVCPIGQDDVIRISVSGIKRGSADNLADVHQVFITHKPKGLFCLYRSSWRQTDPKF